LNEVALDPAFQLVVFSFDLAPRPRGDRLVVTRKQDARALAQYAGALRIGSWLESN
jgi:hypothetical protein